MFKEFKKEFRRQKIRFDQKILVAVSGGVDSMVLWHLMHQSNHIYGVAHVNFSLRGKESDEDQELIETLVKQLNVPYFTIKVDTKAYAKSSKTSIQMAAREIRYDFFNQLFEEHSFEILATAHHLEDNIETFLLNLNRGTGLKGLRGISSSPEKFRPLLTFTKQEIVNYALQNKVQFREDSSNKDLKYDRNWFRHSILKPWQERNPAILGIMKQNLKHLNETYEILEERVQKHTAQLQGELRKGYMKISSIEKLKRKNFYLFHLLSPFGFNSMQINSLIDCIKRKEVGKIFHSKTYLLRIERKKVEFLPHQPSNNSADNFFLIEGDSSLSDPFKIEVKNVEAFMYQPSKNVKTETFDKSKLTFPMVLRKWKKGDKMQPIGMKGKKKISDMLNEKKLTKAEKNNTYVIESENKIIWLVGIRMDHRFRVKESSKNLLTITIE